MRSHPASPFHRRPASGPGGLSTRRRRSKHTSPPPSGGRLRKEDCMSSVKPVPEGYHTVTPFLVLKDAHRAIEFYKRAFGAEERFRMPTPDGQVAHAELQIGDSVVMLSEAIQEPVTSASMYLYVPNVDTVCQRAVAAGAEAVMPPTDISGATGSAAWSIRSASAGASPRTRRTSPRRRSAGGPRRPPDRPDPVGLLLRGAAELGATGRDDELPGRARVWRGGSVPPPPPPSPGRT